MLTPETAQRLIPFRESPNNDLSASFTTKNESFWTTNKINGYYIIGYIINDKLDSLNKQIIPKVRQFVCHIQIVCHIIWTKTKKLQNLAWVLWYRLIWSFRLCKWLKTYHVFDFNPSKKFSTKTTLNFLLDEVVIRKLDDLDMANKKYFYVENVRKLEFI